MTLGEKIREARKTAGFAQEQLAEKLSVSRPAVAKWETDRGLPDVENLKALSALLNVSVDYLLDDSEARELLEIKEPICLDDYPKSGACRSREDAVVLAKYPKADVICPLIRRKKLSKVEWIIDLLTQPGVLEVVDSFNDTSSYYIVEQGNTQFLVKVSSEFIVSTRIARRITERKFEIGGNRFIRAAYTINK